ncbi:hypothetical protein [Variovorax sp. J31P207]|uniref:hypothetical protein n=1 Tax=Variovorax sp. J31P207 TaxID=3053510 RepID=UPI0025763350|nr:hypothetical protein [Variovorax sp. J31P207]MDM0070604.1 hypothetical protein [Variovorax sp. J31P207]
MSEASPDFRLVYRSLSGAPAEHSFPCNPDGEVDLDQLDDRSRNNYFFARAMVGRAMKPPMVERAGRAPRIKGRISA